MSTPLPDDVYTKDEIDQIIVKFSKDLKEMVDNVIIMSRPSIIPDAEETSMWMEVVDEETTGDFDDWYGHNETLHD